MKYRNYNASRMLPLVAFAAMAFATSCSSDSGADGGGGQAVGLTASLDDSTATRVGMTKEADNKVAFYWHSGEAMFVQTCGDSTYGGAKFTTNTETGKVEAKFTGCVASGYTLGSYAVYPYSDSHKFASKTSLTYNLPAAYTYNKVEGNIFSKTTDGSTTYPENSSNVPLVGKIVNGDVDFKHIGGLAVVRIDKMPAAEGTLTVTANQQLSGDFSVDLSADEPKMTTTTSSDNNSVTFTFSNATTNEVGVFYLPLATGSYSGLKIAVDCGSTNSTVDYGSLEMTRAKVTVVPLYNNNGNIVKTIDRSRVINGHEFVDLGLPSGLLWATCNVGASSPTDYGDYFAWGEVTPKSMYSWSTYKYSIEGAEMTKYNHIDKLIELEAADDAATVNWGSGCRMPSYVEFKELIMSDGNGCTLEWVTENGVNGCKITSENEGYAGNSIFLPASGIKGSDYYIWGRGSTCMYWTGSLYLRAPNPEYLNSACLWKIYDTYTYLGFTYRDDYWWRNFGMSVRPVAEP